MNYQLLLLFQEVKDPSKWYKKMYDTIHKNKYDGQYPLFQYFNSWLIWEPYIFCLKPCQ